MPFMCIFDNFNLYLFYCTGIDYIAWDWQIDSNMCVWLWSNDLTTGEQPSCSRAKYCLLINIIINLTFQSFYPRFLKWWIIRGASAKFDNKNSNSDTDDK